MLVLARRPDESIMIGNNIEIKIVEVKGESIKLGITAPKSIPVHRKEVYDAIQRENIAATQTNITDLGKLKDIIENKSNKIDKQEKNKNP